MRARKGPPGTLRKGSSQRDSEAGLAGRHKRHRSTGLTAMRLCRPRAGTAASAPLLGPRIRVNICLVRNRQ
jgi:hypothetical protein